jgi:hypothetical protein
MVWLRHEHVPLRDQMHVVAHPLLEGVWPVQHDVALHAASSAHSSAGRATHAGAVQVEAA